MVTFHFRNTASTEALWGQNLNQTKTKTILGENENFSIFLLPKTVESWDLSGGNSPSLLPTPYRPGLHNKKVA